MVGFTLDEDPSIQLAAWTTTPWTLPSNLCIAVHPDLQYVTVRDRASQKKYILMEEVSRNILVCFSLYLNPLVTAFFDRNKEVLRIFLKFAFVMFHR